MARSDRESPRPPPPGPASGPRPASSTPAISTCACASQRRVCPLHAHRSAARPSSASTACAARIAPSARSSSCTATKSLLEIARAARHRSATARPRATRLSGVRRLLEELRRELPRRRADWAARMRARRTRRSVRTQRGGQRTDAIGHHHRAAAQQRLERGGAGGHQRHVRGRQRRARLAIEHAQLQRAASRPCALSSARIRRTPRAPRDWPSAPITCSPRMRLRQRARRPAGRAPTAAAPRRGGCPAAAPARGTGATSAKARRAPRARSGSQRHLVGERMADELRAHRIVRVEGRLEGQQTQHQVAAARDLARPPLPPRPDLRADVLHGARCPGRLKRPASVRLKAGASTPMNTCGRQASSSPQQPRAQRQQARQMPQRLDQAHDGQLVRIGKRLAAGGAHRRTGDAAHLERAAGELVRSAWISAAPSASPECSPATIATRSASMGVARRAAALSGSDRGPRPPR